MDDSDDICGLCGKAGADKMALHTGGGIYWPGERVPDTDVVHVACENAETSRAFNALSDEQKTEVVLNTKYR